MAKALTINIGINEVDPAHYHGWNGRLKACEADAGDMHRLAEAAGCKGPTILTRQATADRVTAAIADAADQLTGGDLLFLTYSGHGGQVPDLRGGDEEDEQDETWVLYDRQLVDDELYALWGRFAEGVRIFMLSDSCHSGSVAREFPWEAVLPETLGRFHPDAGGEAEAKQVPWDLRDPIYRDNKKLYDDIQKANPDGDEVEVAAHVILISGCQDNQLSLDGRRNGLFTSKLLEVWDGGRFRGGYRGLRRQILNRMPPTQSPNFFLAGRRSVAFERQKPLTV